MSKDERLGPCPACGANMDMVGRRHNCRPLDASAVAKIASREFERPKPTSRLPEPRHISTEKVRTVSAKALAQKPARAAALQAEADKVAAKGRADGKKSVWVSGEQAKLLKMAAAKHETTQEAIVAEGIAVMLGGKYKI